MIWIIVYSLKNKGKIRVEKSIIVGFAIIFSLFSVFQMLVLHVSFYAATFTAIMYFLYATSENPDLEIIDNLKVLTEENKKSSATKTDIILNISHDAITPMNAISNYCSNLLTLKDGSQIDNNANNIINASKDLLNIVDDILEMFGEDKVISNDVYNIYDLCEGLKGVTQARVDKKPIKIIFKIDEKIPLLRGNAIKMYRILVNVLSNAVNNTEVGKIIMNIRGEKINHDDIILHISIFFTMCQQNFYISAFVSQ